MALALITGASRGLGAVLAEQFWFGGYSLLLIARSSNALDSVRARLPNRVGQTCFIETVDLADASSTSLLLKTIEEKYSDISVLINNAATHGPIGPLSSTNMLEWERALFVNLLSPVKLCRLAARLMKANGGSIINIAGGGATSPRANFSAYATSKAGLVRFSETLSAELCSFGINVNCISPGAMPTELLKEVISRGVELAGETELQNARQTFASGHDPSLEVAQLALMLASTNGKQINGKIISAVWDDWRSFPDHHQELHESDVYTLRRIVGRDRGKDWGDL